MTSGEHLETHLAGTWWSPTIPRSTGWTPPTCTRGDQAQKEGENRVFPDILYHVLFLFEKGAPEKCPQVLKGTKTAFLNGFIFSHCHRQTRKNTNMWEREAKHTTFFPDMPITPQSSNLIVVYFAIITFFLHNICHYFFRQHFYVTNKYFLG